MTRNLQVTLDAKGNPLSYFFPNGDSAQKEDWGLLYDFESACRACPSGWRLPTAAEWEQLLGWEQQRLAAPFKDASRWIGEQNTNNTAFSAIPAGYGNEGEFDNFFGEKAIFWSQTPDEGPFVWTYIFERQKDSLRKASQHPTYAFAVRCVQDSHIVRQRLEVRMPSAEMEAEYVWQNLQDLPFFEQNNYQLRLPSGKLIESLKEKARHNALDESDQQALIQFMEDSVYHIGDYEKGYEHVITQLPAVNRMLARIIEGPKNWHFQHFPTHQITLTLYGPGGSYHPHDGSILLFTTPFGSFKSYENPANTLIHELIHIGIEESIIQKYQLPHSLKERVVDNIVMLFFQKELPTYRKQPMGNAAIDSLIRTDADFERLDEIIAFFMKK